jgi:hypothetical protein
MSRPRLSLLVGVVTLLALNWGAGPAYADHVGFEPGGNITMEGPLSFSLEGLNVECNVTLRGSLTRELVSTAAGTTVGSLSEEANTCAGGTRIRFLVPPSVMVLGPVLRSLGGEVTGWLVRIENFGVLVEASLGLLRCLYGMTLAFLIAAGREFASVTFLGPFPMRIVRSLNAFTCPGGTMSGGPLNMRPAQRGIYLPF